MTLSLNHLTMPWERTLPRPSTLLPNGDIEVYPRRSNSLLHHHVVGNQLLDINEGYLAENGRRSTVACIPVTQVSEQAIINADTSNVPAAHLDPGEVITRKRTSSVMSVEGTSRSSSPTSTSPVEGHNQFCLCQKEPKIPRPRNAFILYRQHHHAAVVAQHPSLANPDISKIIGEQWRRLPEKAKEEWKALAEDEKARHSQQYPGYRYKPRRHGKLAGPSSISVPPSVSSDITSTCPKCGGKPMSAPLTPYTPITPATPATLSMPQLVGLHQSRPKAFLTDLQSARMPVAQQIVSPPHSARMRQYTDAYGRPGPSAHDLRFQYAPVPSRQSQMAEGPEPKKRRLNGEAVFSSRPTYTEQPYQCSPHERTMSDAMVAGQFHRPNMGPPARTGYPVQMPPNRPPPPYQHRRDSSLTLPPLKTPLSQSLSLSLSAGTQSQRSGVEAMIMSIPVLNKVKILSQIAPCLAAPGPASPPRKTRGFIIAVEGMDPSSIYNMTHTLADQLEKAGKFAVRIFSGPNPYTILASSNRASNGDGEQLTVSGFLDIISQWHKISKEMQDYVTKIPIEGDDSPDDVVMGDVEHCIPPRCDTNTDHSGLSSSPRTPISAVSPKTIIQTADLTLASLTLTKGQTSDRESLSKTPQPKSRIPASAIAQAHAEAEAADRRPTTHSPSDTTSTPRPPTTDTCQPQDQYQAARRPTIAPAGPLIPIAIVPHYQLTTVDASSIAMPITDAYSPHSHWQWLATLWRGCLGPDATVIIQAGDIAEEGEHSAGAGSGTTRIDSQPFVVPSTVPQPAQHGFSAGNTTAGPPRQPPAQRPHQPQTTPSQLQQLQHMQQQQQHQDVEVRLLDCRAVVVRAPPTANAVKGRDCGDRWEGNEWWEKAKRRVGFEVEEFLRR